MCACPACGERGVPVAARLFAYLFEPLACRRCSAELFAHPWQGACGMAVTMLFAVLGMAVLVASPYALPAVVALYIAARIGIAFAFPLTLAP